VSDVVGYEVRDRNACLTLNRPGQPIPDGGGPVPTTAEPDEG